MSLAGEVRRDEVRHGRVWLGEVRQGRQGIARQGLAERGKARRGEARQARQGKARRGWARHGAARYGRHGKARLGAAGQGRARRGAAGKAKNKITEAKLMDHQQIQYQWKTREYKTPAQEAGEELERIKSKRGKLTASNVVDESRSWDAVLHQEFDWDDEKAAEKHREAQARTLIGNLVTVIVTPREHEPTHHTVRAYVHTPKEYERVDVALKKVDTREYILNTAKSELITFRRKYNALTELANVIHEIDILIESEAQ